MEALKAVILAAGKGTRMQSDLPKVVHTIDGKCLVDYVIEAAEGAGAEDICLVVGYKHEEVENTISHKDDVTFVLQEQQLGTGHAVKCAKDFLGKDGHTLILFGDAPLITSATLKQLLEHHIQHIVLLRCAVFLFSKTFACCFDHDLHHEAVNAVQLLHIKVSLQGEQRNVGWNF